MLVVARSDAAVVFYPIEESRSGIAEPLDMTGHAALIFAMLSGRDIGRAAPLCDLQETMSAS